MVDSYGFVVARAMVNGGDFDNVHHKMQHLLKAMICKANYNDSAEAMDIFSVKVEAGIMAQYIRMQERKDFIIPDLLIHNYDPDNNNK